MRITGWVWCGFMVLASLTSLLKVIYAENVRDRVGALLGAVINIFLLLWLYKAIPML